MRVFSLLVAVLLLSMPVGAGTLTGDVPGSQPAVDGHSISVTTSTAESDLQSSSDVDTASTRGSGPAEMSPQIANRSTSRVLTVPSSQVEQTKLDRHHGNLASVIDTEATRVSNQINTTAVINNVESAPSVDEREIRTLDAVTRIEQAEVSLNRRQRDAIKRYSQGELTDREFLLETRHIAVRANSLRDRLDALRPYTSEFGLESRRINVDFLLQTYDGPVRSYAERIARGDTPAGPIYIETGGESVTMAAIIDTQYVRETFRGDRWKRSGNTFDSLEDAESITSRAYPEAWAKQTTRESTGSGGVFQVSVSNPGGSLTTFVGTGSNKVFKSHQRFDLAELSPDTYRVVTQEGLEATVEYSYRGGPARVAIRDPDTGEPIENVVVTVGIGAQATKVGSTDSRGTVWMLEPGETYRIRGVVDPSVVGVTQIEPRLPPTTDDQPAQTKRSNPDETTQSVLIQW